MVGAQDLDYGVAVLLNVRTHLAKSHGRVFLEDLRVKSMSASAKGSVEQPGTNVAAKAGLNRSILAQGWGMFTGMLRYKLAERGGELVLVDPRNTSRRCPACGHTVAENRRKSRFRCVACGHEADADLNAALNILAAGLAAAACGGSGAGRPGEAGTCGEARACTAPEAQPCFV